MAWRQAKVGLSRKIRPRRGARFNNLWNRGSSVKQDRDYLSRNFFKAKKPPFTSSLMGLIFLRWSQRKITSAVSTAIPVLIQEAWEHTRSIPFSRVSNWM